MNMQNSNLINQMTVKQENTQLAVFSCELKEAWEKSQKKFKIVTAESLTGGMIASTISMVPGSSRYFDRSFVVYNNEAKHEMLGVKKNVFDLYTEVSGQCVMEMACGALEHSHAEVAVSVSGVAGPDLGGDGNPVGTVWIGVCIKAKSPACLCKHFAGNREEIRFLTVGSAFDLLKNIILTDQYPSDFLLKEQFQDY